MAIRLKDYQLATYKARGKEVVIPNLYQKKEKDPVKGYAFLASFTLNGKPYRKVLGYSEKDKLTVKKASELLNAYRNDIEEGYTPTGAITLDKLHELYFETVKDSDWNTKKKHNYKLYLQKPLGKKSIDSIREMDIRRVVKSMHEKGLSPRTQKGVLEILKPMFNFATTNKILKENPAHNINVTIPSQKKIVTNATELFIKVFGGINEYYKDDPFYRALFLFGFSGRRKGEILKLKWENIDFSTNFYWLEHTKNNDNQQHKLPRYLIDALNEIKSDHVGLVFKSPITGKKIINTDRQMRQLKRYIGIDNLSLHYMRNILVSMLAENGTEAITLSGILGHKDPNTIIKYLSINHRESSIKGLEKIEVILDAEII